MFAYACLDQGRRLYMLDTTHEKVPLATGTYVCSGVVKNADRARSCGYKLVTLRTLLTSYRSADASAMAAIRAHEVVLCRSLLENISLWRAGDLLVEDRGFLDMKEL